MPKTRRYDDPCGTARALEVIGERWAVLIVRELLLGPKRFGAIRAGLHGVSPNVLSQRLRELQSAAVVRRDTLPPPADVAVYELTERGHALEPVLLELGRWGSREPIDTDSDLGIDALMLALKTLFSAEHAFDAIFGITVDREDFRVAIHDRAINVRRGAATDARTNLTTDVNTLRAVAFGRETISHAEADHRLTIAGDRRPAQKFSQMFSPPDADLNQRTAPRPQ